MAEMENLGRFWNLPKKSSGFLSRVRIFVGLLLVKSFFVGEKKKFNLVTIGSTSSNMVMEEVAHNVEIDTHVLFVQSKYPIVGEESIMSKKAHGTTDKPVQVAVSSRARTPT